MPGRFRVELLGRDGWAQLMPLDDYAAATELAHRYLEGGCSVRVVDSSREGDPICWEVVRHRAQQPADAQLGRITSSTSGKENP